MKTTEVPQHQEPLLPAPTSGRVSPFGPLSRPRRAADVPAASVTAAATTTITVGLNPTYPAVTADGKLYVPIYGLNAVTVVDTATDTVIGAPIDVGIQPAAIAFAPNGKAYVTNTGSGTVSAIDTATDTVVGSPIPVGSGAFVIAVAPNAHAYVTDFYAGTVWVIDTTTDTVVGDPIPVGAMPAGVAVAPNNRVYVCNRSSNTVSVIDTATDTVVGDPIPVGFGPQWIAFAPNGNGYVVNIGSGDVTVIDPDTDQVVGDPIPVGTDPWGIAVAPDGMAYVALQGENVVRTLDTATNTVVGDPIPAGIEPLGVAVAPNGKVYVTDFGGGTVTVIAPPITLTAVSPAQGSVLGGTQVVLTGTNLSGVTEVTFGGRPATDLFYNAAGTRLIVTTPAGNPGPVDVTVTSPSRSATLADGFTYVSTSPTLTSIAPDEGLETGGTQVLLTGTNLSGATVTIGGLPATGVFYSAAGTQILATTPPHAPGTADVTVSTPSGEATLAGGFRYIPLPPFLTGIDPAAGPVAGGTTVTLTGSHLLGATAVTFNGVPGTGVSVNPEGTQLTVVTPAGAAGPAAVAVTTPGGTSNELTFTYAPLPAPTQISPSQGPSTGGTTVTITGTALFGATAVTFNGVPGTGVSVNPEGTQLTVVTPAGAAGPAAVAVTTPGGTATVPGGFLYNDVTSLTAAPAIIRPAGLLSFVIPSLSATLTDAVTHAPLAGRTVTFSITTVAGRISLGSAVTNDSGVATRTNVSVPSTAITATSYTAAFAGTPGYLPSTATGTLTFSPLG